MMTRAQREWITARIATTPKDGFPPQASINPLGLLVFATDGLFAYYLGSDGHAYELDLDRAAQSYDRVTDTERLREVYRRANAKWPELALVIP
jgi:hypothetical protein